MMISPTLIDIEKRSALMHEPKWLRQQRMSAWKAFLELSFPDWKKTKTPPLELKKVSFSVPSKDFEPQIPSKKFKRSDAAGELILEGSEVKHLTLQPQLANSGVLFLDLQTAVLERADFLETYFQYFPVVSKTNALHRALWNNGFLIFVPQDVIIEEPFYIRIVQKKSEETFFHRGVMILERGAHATVEERFESQKNDQQLRTAFSSTEIFAEENAKLQYWSTQQYSPYTYDHSVRYLHAKKNAHIQSLFSVLGGSSGDISIRGELEEEGANIDHHGIFVGRGHQHFRITAKMNHRAKNTTGHMKVKGILKDESYLYLDGLIRVDSNANKSISDLEEQTLLLSDKARSDALPALDIKTSDVKVSHSAAVMHADQEKIFYLMSRGLSKQEANNLIVEGFFENILSRIKDFHFYQNLKKMLEQKLYAEFYV